MSSLADQQALKIQIDGFLKGDSVQFRLIKTKVTQYVYHQRFGDSATKDEIISETLEILYTNLKNGKFRGDSITALSVYIYSIIRFRCLRQHRESVRTVVDDERLAEMPDYRPSPAEETTCRDLANRILSSLDPNCRNLLELKFKQQWTDQEIADHLKKTKNATSTAISRCVDKARGMNFVQDAM